jgi:hypothetical protein
VFQGSATFLTNINSPVLTRHVVRTNESVAYIYNDQKTEKRQLNGVLTDYWNAVNRTFEYYNPSYRSNSENPGFAPLGIDRVPQGYSLPPQLDSYSTAAYNQGQYGVSPPQEPVRPFEAREYAEYNYNEETGSWYPSYVDTNYGLGKYRALAEDPFANNPAHELKPGMEFGYSSEDERGLGISSTSPTPGPLMITPDGHLLQYYDPSLYSYSPNGQTFLKLPEDPKKKKKK